MVRMDWMRADRSRAVTSGRSYKRNLRTKGQRQKENIGMFNRIIDLQNEVQPEARHSEQA